MIKSEPNLGSVHIIALFFYKFIYQTHERNGNIYIKNN